MLKKIQNLWNFVIKKKKITNNINLYNIKNNFLFTNAINNSLTFFITGLKKIKSKQIKLIDKSQSILNYYRIFLFLFFLFFLSFLFYLVFLF